MTDPVYLTCGHAANATHQGAHDGLPDVHPCCAIDDTCTAASKPDLTRRTAVCAYDKGGRYYTGANHGEPVPSSWDLAFFEYRGPGSKAADQICVCGYHEIAHQRQEQLVDPRSVIERGYCQGFVPRGPEDHDLYYDGCWGWD